MKRFGLKYCKYLIYGFAAWQMVAHAATLTGPPAFGVYSGLGFRIKATKPVDTLQQRFQNLTSYTKNTSFKSYTGIDRVTGDTFKAYTSIGREQEGVANALVVAHNALGSAHSGHFTNTSNPHSTTAAQVGAPSNAKFTNNSTYTAAHIRSLIPGHPAAGSDQDVQINVKGVQSGAGFLKYSSPNTFIPAGGKLGVGKNPTVLIHSAQTDAGTNNIVEMRRTERTSSGTAIVGFGVKDTKHLPIAGTTQVVHEQETSLSGVGVGSESATFTLRNMQQGSLRDSMVIAAQPFFYRYLPALTFSAPQAAGQIILKKGLGTMTDGVGPRLGFQVDNNAGTQLVVGAVAFPTDLTNSRSSLVFQVRGSSSDTFADTEIMRGTYDKRLGVGTTTPRGTFDGYSGIGGKGKIYAGSATNYAQVSQDLGLRYAGNTTTFIDLRVEPNAKTAGATDPTFDVTNFTGGGIGLYNFDDSATEKQVYFSLQLPHEYKVNSALACHVHWVGRVNDTTAAPRWGLEYTWANHGATFPAHQTIYSTGVNVIGDGATDPDVTAGIHYKSVFADITPTAGQGGISSILLGRLFRNSTDAGDTYNAANADCGLMYIDCHIEVDSTGSDTPYGKTATP